MPPITIKSKIFNILSIVCACHLFFAGLNLPEVFYEYLRVIVTCVALLTMVNNIGKNMFFVVTFGMVALIFNPIVPLYLDDKAIWVLLDIITALLFLFEAYDIHAVAPSEVKTRKRRRLFRYKLK
tara:strand:- start:70 stop:444 length:375 start_codon:yes stop_codon:yes gene_type:complete